MATTTDLDLFLIVECRYDNVAQDMQCLLCLMQSLLNLVYIFLTIRKFCIKLLLDGGRDPL
jgi:hypothetical protein